MSGNEVFEPPAVFPEDRWIIEVQIGDKFHRITCSDEEYAHYLNNHDVILNVIPFVRPPDPPRGQDTQWFQYQEGSNP